MGKERIKLDDFLKEINNFVMYDGFDEAMKPNILKKYVCLKCGKLANEDDKFCSKDGAEIREESYEIRNDDYEDFVRNVFLDISEGFGLPEDFPYEYVDSIEKRGDGDGYYVNYIFKRKSDGKFFYYTSYDGRIEEDTLDETFKEVKVRWDFERFFS